MAEHMIRTTARLHGFSRERILAQLQREYDRDVAGEMALFEASNKHHPEATFVERISKLYKRLEDMVPLPVR
jgi:hypothetical protein